MLRASEQLRLRNGSKASPPSFASFPSSTSQWIAVSEINTTGNGGTLIRRAGGSRGIIRRMLLDRGSIDLVLVPSGLAIMFLYHLILLGRILHRPQTTVVGYENHNKLAWVERMLRATPEETSLALTVISGSVSASSNMASLSIALSSLIGTWAGSTSKVFVTAVIYGDTSQPTTSVKYISLLVCFLAAFTFFIHSARYLVHASYLMSTIDSDIPLAYVQRAVIRGGNFWALGLRALYFATVLLMWIFGPIPMFLSSALMVLVLHFLDSNSMPLHPHSFRRLPAPKKAAAAKGVWTTPEIGALSDHRQSLYASTTLLSS